MSRRVFPGAFILTIATNVPLAAGLPLLMLMGQCG
jgi:hypothetical protein